MDHYDDISYDDISEESWYEDDVMYRKQWYKIALIKFPKLETEKRAIRDSKGEALSLITLNLDLLAYIMEGVPEAFDYLLEHEGFNPNEHSEYDIEKLCILIVQLHYKKRPEIIENLNVFKDKTYLTYIKLIAGV